MRKKRAGLDGNNGKSVEQTALKSTNWSRNGRRKTPQSLETTRTAGRCDWGVGGKPTALLYLAQNRTAFVTRKIGVKSSNFRSKVLSQIPPISYLLEPTLGCFSPAFQFLSQTAYVWFHRLKREHTRLFSKNRTQRPTCRNTGFTLMCCVEYWIALSSRKRTAEESRCTP